MNSEIDGGEKASVTILDRGMNREECKAACMSPQIPLREKLFFRMIYETTTKPREVLEARIELWNRATCESTFPKTRKLTFNTNEMLRHYLGNRKKGHVFINERTERRLTLRHFEKEIDKWARLLNIQKLQSIKPSGKNYSLVTLMALREAGERHHDLNGGDPDVSSKGSEAQQGDEGEVLQEGEL
jgi:hypothetical protein